MNQKSYTLNYCNSPETFQRMMNSIFRELLYEGVLANYIDDFVILVKTIKELKKKNNMIFEDSRKTQSLFQMVKI